MKSSRQQLRALLQALIETCARAFVLALLIISISPPASNICAQTVEATKPPESAGQNQARNRSTVRGRVVYDDSGRPLRRVRVTIYDPAGGSDNRYQATWTDGNGEFILQNVAAGKYYVVAEAPGIISENPSDSSSDVTDVATVSVNGTNSAEVKVRARRGGIISGKVTYSDGEPAINALVSILRKKDGKTTPVYLSNWDCGNEVRTDERGVYRVAGLPSGEYTVGAGEMRTREIKQDNGRGTYINRAVPLVTYYEGTTSARSATPIQVEAGSETNNVNITLVERSMHSISGTVSMRGDPHPLTQAMITLVNKDEPNSVQYFVDNQMTTPDAQGRWSFDDVVDGAYTITVTPARQHEDYFPDLSGASAASNRRPQAFVVKRRDVIVAGADVANLAIEVTKGGRISGTVTVEGGKPLPSYIFISPESADNKRSIQLPGTPRVLPNGSFAIDGLPSDGIWISVFLRQENNKYYTKAVTANGVDLMREPLMVPEGEEVKGVHILLSPEVATLTGRVLTAEGGASLRNTSILLLPAELDKQRIRSARLYGVTNAEGSFTITGAPGEYLVLILRPGSEPYSLGDQAVKALAANAQRITLQPNERKKMDFIAPVSK